MRVCGVHHVGRSFAIPDALGWVALPGVDQFATTRLRPGYARQEVDGLLQEISRATLVWGAIRLSVARLEQSLAQAMCHVEP